MELCTAIRRFITRYLSGKSGENIIKNNKKLKSNLLNGEFWNGKFGFVEDKLNRMFGDVDVKVYQAFKLYEYLGGDKIDKNKLNEIIVKNKEEDSSEYEKENENEKEDDEESEHKDKIENEEDEQDEHNSDDDYEHKRSDSENENEENEDDSLGY